MDEIIYLLDYFYKYCQSLCRSRLEKDLPLLLYHFTSYKGLKGILESRKIKFTHYEDLNDSTEIKYAQEYLLNKFIGINIKYKNSILYCLRNSHLNKKLNNIFTSSFSDNYDNLALWRFYAKNGNGFCLELDVTSHICYEGKDIALGKVQYGCNLLMEIAQNLCNKLDEISTKIDYKISFLDKPTLTLLYRKLECRNVSPEVITSIKKEIEIKLVKTMVANLIVYSPLFKHSGFASEKEYRMIIMDYIPSRIIKNTSNRDVAEIINQEYQVQSKEIKQQVTYSDILPKNFIKQIFIGPCCSSTVEAFISKLLLNMGYKNVKVNTYLTPYRG